MAGDYGIKIAKQGFDVKTFLTELNKKNFNILSTEDALVRKELSASPSNTNMFLGYILTPDEDEEYYFGTILTISISNVGSNYEEYDFVDVTGGGGTSASLVISSVNGSGGVTGCYVSMGGKDYEVGSNIATSGGLGTGFTVNILSVTTSEFARVRPLNCGAGSPIYVIYENLMS